jgi:hypothetical protein
VGRAEERAGQCSAGWWAVQCRVVGRAEGRVLQGGVQDRGQGRWQGTAGQGRGKGRDEDQARHG